MESNEQELMQLENAGLSRDESSVYLTLLRRGGLPASTVARMTGVTRVMTYRVLDELAGKDLVKKIDQKGSISRFYPQHPFALARLVDKRKEEVELATKAVENVVTKLSTDYLRVMGEPGVRVLVGKSGHAEMLKDIEMSEETLNIIRTPKDSQSEEIIDSIRSHVKWRANKGIMTRVIAPFLSSYDSNIFKWDKENHVQRRFVSPDELLTDGQISIYGEKVAIVSYQETGPVITLIHDKAISTTFLLLFEYIWKRSLEFTEKAFAEIKTRPSERNYE